MPNRTDGLLLEGDKREQWKNPCSCNWKRIIGQSDRSDESIDCSHSMYGVQHEIELPGLAGLTKT